MSALSLAGSSFEWGFSRCLADAAQIETRNPGGVRTETGLLGKASMLS